MAKVVSVKIGKTPTYLFRKGRVYYFRIAIPIDVREAFGRTEINYSLQTNDLKHALFKANYLYLCYKNYVRQREYYNNKGLEQAPCIITFWLLKRLILFISTVF